jgi:site-specific recombinase XerD
VKLFRKPKSKFYWYDFTVRGQRYRGSTQETKAARAATVASMKLAQVVDRTDPLPRSGARNQDWVFPSKHAVAGHLTTIGHWFRQARRKAGLPEGLVLYCGRHDYGTRVLMRGLWVQSFAPMLNWLSIAQPF